MFDSPPSSLDLESSVIIGGPRRPTNGANPYPLRPGRLHPRAIRPSVTLPMADDF
jgi:hypothetical protein